MNGTFKLVSICKHSIRVSTSLAIAIAATLSFEAAHAQTPTVNLGSDSTFGILAGSEITDAGGLSTITTGNVGLSPATGAAIGLLAPQVIGGTIYAVDAAGPVGSVNNPALLTTAKNDLTTAYNDAAGRPVSSAFGVIDNQLGGKTLFPGVYSFGHAATANLIGTLTLDGNGVANPVWIFQATSDLVTAGGAPGSPGAKIVLKNGATACDVFWQVGSSATIGTYADFTGIIMADQSIALQTGATLDGSALARIAAVTLDHNSIISEDCTDFGGSGGSGGTGGGGGTETVPDAGNTLLLFAIGLAPLYALKRWFIVRV